MNEVNSQIDIDQLVNYFFILTEQQLSKKHDSQKIEEITKKFRTNFLKLLAQYDKNPTKKYYSINPIFLISLHEAQEIIKDELLEQMMNVYRSMLHEMFFSQKSFKYQFQHLIM